MAEKVNLNEVHITQIDVDQINKMSRNELLEVLRKYSKNARRTRDRVLEYYERNNLRPFQNYATEEKSTIKSWRYTDFHYDNKMNQGQLKRQVMQLKRFYSSSMTSVKGQQEYVRKFRETFLARLGLDRGNKYIKSLGREPREFRKWYDISRTFFEVFEKVNEGSHTYSSSQAYQAVVQYFGDKKLTNFDITDVDSIAMELRNILVKGIEDAERKERENISRIYEEANPFTDSWGNR